MPRNIRIKTTVAVACIFVLLLNSVSVMASFENTQTPVINVSEAEAEAYFNDSVFIGDSVLEGLAQYVRGCRKDKPMLGNAKFLTAVSGIRLADCAGDMGDNTIFFSYKGEETPVDQCVFNMGVSKAFIMLGMNDLAGGFSITDSIERYNRTIDKVNLLCPDVEIIILLNSPKTATLWLPWYIANKNFDNVLIDSFVEEVKVMCVERNMKYIDLNSVLKGDDNALPQSLCRDNYVHLNNAGSEIVVNQLYEFAKVVIASENVEKTEGE